MTATAQLQAMIDKLEALKTDADKLDRGQKAAGTRIRKTMQEIKSGAQSLRTAVLDAVKAAPSKAA